MSQFTPRMEIKMISAKRLQELRHKLEQQRVEENQKEIPLYEPPLLTPEEIEKHQFSSSFVKSHEYLRRNYKMLSDIYGDQIWLIIVESGVVEASHDHDKVYHAFYSGGYAGNAILTCVGQKGTPHKYTKMTNE